MRFLVDECVGPTVALWLHKQNHEVFSVFEKWRGASDDEIIHKCHDENYILITSDKDFGEMVFRSRKVHSGIILLRCEPNTFQQKITVLKKLLENFPEKLSNNFVVVTNDKVRIIEF